MLFRDLRITNSGSHLTLSLEDESNGYFIKDITGLEPGKATIASSTFANLDGEQFHSSRTEVRNIVLTLGLKPDYVSKTPYMLRNELYSYLMPKDKVTLRFTIADMFSSSTERRLIDGYVESFEYHAFEKEPFVTVSILCMNPAFRGPGNPQLSLQSVENNSMNSFEYEGNLNSGITFVLVANREIPGPIVISHENSYGDMTYVVYSNSDYTPVRPLVDLDILRIGSHPGDKFARVTQINGVSWNVLYTIAPQSGWITLTPGTNKIGVQIEGAPVGYNIIFQHLYGGL